MKELAELLIKTKIDDYFLKDMNRNRLQILLSDPKVVGAYKAAVKAICEKDNLLPKICTQVIAFVSGMDPKIELWKAIAAGDVKKFADIIQSNANLLNDKTAAGDSIVTYAIKARRFNILQSIIEFYQHKNDYLGLVSLMQKKEKEGLSAYDLLPRNFARSHLDLNNFIIAEKIRASIKNIVSYVPKENATRTSQRHLLFDFLQAR